MNPISHEALQDLVIDLQRERETLTARIAELETKLADTERVGGGMIKAMSDEMDWLKVQLAVALNRAMVGWTLIDPVRSETWPPDDKGLAEVLDVDGLGIFKPPLLKANRHVRADVFKGKPPRYWRTWNLPQDGALGGYIFEVEP